MSHPCGTVNVDSVRIHGQEGGPPRYGSKLLIIELEGWGKKKEAVTLKYICALLTPQKIRRPYSSGLSFPARVLHRDWAAVVTVCKLATCRAVPFLRVRVGLNTQRE